MSQKKKLLVCKKLEKDLTSAIARVNFNVSEFLEDEHSCYYDYNSESCTPYFYSPTFNNYSNIQEEHCVDLHTCTVEADHCSHQTTDILATKFIEPRRDPPSLPVYDKRTNLEIATDITNILLDQYSPEFKACLDKYLSRDSQIKEIADSVYLTQRDIRSLVKQYKAQNYGLPASTDTSAIPTQKSSQGNIYDELLREFQQDTEAGELSLVNYTNNERASSLPHLTAALRFSSPHTQECNVDCVLDTGATHSVIPTKYLKLLNIKEENIDRSRKYILDSSTQTGSDSILGNVKLTLILQNNKGTNVTFQVEFLVLNSPLKFCLLGNNFLKPRNYEIVNVNRAKHLVLDVYRESVQSRHYFLISPHQSPAIQCHNLMVGDNEILISNEPTVDNIETYYPVSHHSLEDHVYSRLKMINDGPTQLHNAPNLEHCTVEQREEIKSILDQFPEVFAKNKFQVGTFTDFQVPVKTRAGTIVKSKNRPYSSDQKLAINELIENFLENKIISPAPPNTPHYNSCIIVQEKLQLKLSSKADKMLTRYRKQKLEENLDPERFEILNPSPSSINNPNFRLDPEFDPRPPPRPPCWTHHVTHQ